MTGLFLSLICAYFIGSIPTSYIFAKFLKKIDIREHGSGNVGATNVFRTVGKMPAILVLFIDVFKGSFAVWFLPRIFLNNTIGMELGLEFYQILLGLSVISGHVFNVFLKFKGGKGVATTAGVLLVLSPKILAGSAIVWVLVFYGISIVSVASIMASVFLPIFACIFYRSFSQPLHMVLFTALLCLAGTYKHKENIKRLMRGEEKKLF